MGATPLIPPSPVAPETAARSPAFSGLALRPSPAGRLLLAVLIAIGAARHGVVTPGRNYLSDFRAYYAAGVALHEGLSPYDTPLLRERINPRLPGNQTLCHFTYPPPTLPIVYALAALPLPAAQVVWCLAQYALVTGALALALRGAGIPFGSPAAVLLGVLYLESQPVHELFRWGQWDGLVAFLVAGAFCALQRGRSGRGGLWLALAGLAKFFPLFYLCLPVLRRDRRLLLSAGGAVAVLLGGALALLSAPTRADYLVNATFKLGGTVYYVPAANMSLFGYVYRALVDWPHGKDASRAWVDLGPQTASVVAHGLALLIFGLTAFWIHRHRHALTAGESLAALVPVLLLVTPVAWSFHSLQLVVPLALAVRAVAAAPRPGRGDTVWLAAMLALYAFNPVLRYELELPHALRHLAMPTTTYAVALTWLFMLVRYRRLRGGARDPVPAGS